MVMCNRCGQDIKPLPKIEDPRTRQKKAPEGELAIEYQDFVFVQEEPLSHVIGIAYYL